MILHVNLDKAERLDEFVRSHPRGHFMQSSLWGRVKAGWGWHGILCLDRRGRVVGSLALLEHPCRLPGTCLLYGPRGPICDDARTFRLLVNAAREYGRERGAWVLRLDPEVEETDREFRAMVRDLGFRFDAAEDFSLFQPRLCYVLDLAGRTEAELPACYHRSTRYNVRHAEKGPLRVRFGGPEDLPAFCAMMEQTAARQGFKPRREPYFRALLEGFGDCVRFWIAELEGRAVAGAITAVFGASCSLLYACSDEEGRRQHANELLEYRAQLDAIRCGCRRYDFRGVEGRPTEENPAFGLHRYKQGFGAEFKAWIGQLDLVLRPGVAKVYRWYEALRSCRGRRPRRPACTDRQAGTGRRRRRPLQNELTESESASHAPGCQPKTQASDWTLSQRQNTASSPAPSRKVTRSRGVEGR